MQYSIVSIIGLSLLTVFFINSRLTDTSFFNSGNSNSQEKSKEIAIDSSDKPKNIKHDLSCLRNEDIIGTGIGIANELEGIFTKAVDVEVSLEEERKVGEEVKTEQLKKYRILNNKEYTDRIDRIMKKLLSNLKNPRFDYKWYVLDSDVLNAFTAGGYIFIFKGIIDFSKDDAEIAAILSHELYHNELEHIKDRIKKIKIAEGIFGEYSQLPIIAASLLTTSFNQENEANCDLYGIDLCEKSGYDGCKAENLWKRMSKNEGSHYDIEKLLRSHPFSDDRANCIKTHLNNNYNKKCNH